MTFKHKYLFLVVLASVMIGSVFGQAAGGSFEETMYSDGKINVVIAVIAGAFVLITIYLISLDRKLKKIEERENRGSK